ncbi:hypothetical protein GCM10007086_42790 [Photobacterium aphoticum]|nr:hypothetical protein GCM10007086_42790 [Photobacterium aphoticum]
MNSEVSADIKLVAHCSSLIAHWRIYRCYFYGFLASAACLNCGLERILCEAECDHILTNAVSEKAVESHVAVDLSSIRAIHHYPYYL